MQYFYSPDGAQQHGPVDRDQLIAAGVLATTKVWREGLSGWVPASEVPELADLFVNSGANTTADSSSQASPETAQQEYELGPAANDPSTQHTAADMGYATQHQVGYQQHYPHAQPTNGMAIASLICGIVGIVTSCLFVPSILAVVFGHIARGQIRRGQGTGDGMALAGLIMGYIWLALSVLGLIAYVLFFVAVIAGAAATGPNRIAPGPVPIPAPPATPGTSSFVFDSFLQTLAAIASQLTSSLSI